MDDIIAIEYDITPNIANMLKLGQDLADMTNRAMAAELAMCEFAEKNLRNVELCTQALQQRDEWRQRAEAAERAVTWIPVAERLPEPDLRVLAVYSEEGRKRTIIRALYLPPKYATCDTEYEEAVYDHETDQLYFPGGWYEATEGGEYAFVGPMEGTVTHWMQLPALPDGR